MSITKEFEERRIRADEFIGTTRVYGANDVRALLAHARALEAMLENVQWSYGGDECPICYRSSVYDYAKHTPDCQLAKLLEGV